MRTSRAALAVSLLVSAPFAATAQQPFELEPIVLGGGLTPVDAQSYARAVTVIDGQTLREQGIARVADALRGTPGVSVSRVGGPGGETSVRIRGSENNHVLVLVDGVEVATGAEGFDFSSLTADQIERIEVLRGPQSALYGAGATAGVINVITRGGAGVEGARVSAFAEAGTQLSGAGGVLGQFGTGRGNGAISFTYRDDAGWDASGDGGEKDGARSAVLNARGAFDATEDLSLRGSLRYVNRRSEFDDTVFGCGGPDCYVTDASGRRTDGEDVLAGLALDWATLGGALVHTPSVSYARTETDTIADFGPSWNDNDTTRAGYQLAWTFGPEGAHTLVGALQFKREGFENAFAGGDRKERDQLGYVLDYRGQWTDRLFVQGGARFDDNEDFDDFLSWSASASYQFFETGTRLRASVGRAQTNPTFFEQFGFVPGEFTGNPDLEPERNFGWDFGIDQDFWGGRARAGVTYFDERLEDEIAGFGDTVRNLDGTSTRRGVELSASVDPLDGLTLAASYTFLDAEEPGGEQEVRRPTHEGALSARYAFLDGRARVGAEAQFAAGAVDFDFGDPSFAGPRADLEDRIVVNLDAGYRFAESAEVYGAVRNLLDAEYEDVLGYAAEPLTAVIGVRVDF